ncbi:hypothetical protein NC651_037099 [Populus alba x Populus x berolinensis]|nr:hypothetical protein NC651_037099 [Populus alba x Populus x berolinensis]
MINMQIGGCSFSCPSRCLVLCTFSCVPITPSFPRKINQLIMVILKKKTSKKPKRLTMVMCSDNIYFSLAMLFVIT